MTAELCHTPQLPQKSPCCPYDGKLENKCCLPSLLRGPLPFLRFVSPHTMTALGGGADRWRVVVPRAKGSLDAPEEVEGPSAWHYEPMCIVPPVFRQTP